MKWRLFYEMELGLFGDWRFVEIGGLCADWRFIEVGGLRRLEVCGDWIIFQIKISFMKLMSFYELI